MCDDDMLAGGDPVRADDPNNPHDGPEITVQVSLDDEGECAPSPASE